MSFKYVRFASALTHHIIDRYTCDDVRCFQNPQHCRMFPISMYRLTGPGDLILASENVQPMYCHQGNNYSGSKMA